MLDYLIQGGIVIDGSGAPGRRADVGIANGRIIGVGSIDELAREVIDASSLVVAPGFIDPHTHYDAQLCWDPWASPSSLHGVTSVIAGNCGFSLAPLSPSNADYLIEMMVRVEGMPKEALTGSLAWDWRSFGDFLDRFGSGLGVNAGFFVGHCALRREVMGEDSVGGEATDAQLDAMRRLLGESLRSGGLGFSTTQAFNHADGNGDPVPSRFADARELLALAEVAGAHDGTSLEWVTTGCLHGFSPEEVELMIGMSLRARRPMNWNLLTIDSAAPERYRHQMAASSLAEQRGARIVALTMPTLVGMNMSFGSYCALNLLPEWGPILSLPIPERIARLNDPATRASMERSAASPEAAPLGRVTGWSGYRIGDTYSSANEAVRGRLVADIARERGIGAFDALLDIVVADQLKTVLWPGPTDDDPESWRLRAEAWDSGYTMLGGSDAGAHLDRMFGAGYTTAFLGDCIRGKQLTSLENAVRHMTAVPAELFGLRDRGRLVEGSHADVVVFDPSVVDCGEVVLRRDLPGGASRLYGDAIGIEKVFVNGSLTVDGDGITRERPGVVLRSGAETTTSR